MIKKHQPLRKFPDYKSSISRSPNKEPLWINSSSSEMSGPLFNEKIINKNDNDLTLNFSKTGEKPLGQEIFVHGFVKDENGNNLKNVLIEIWQANAGGKYRHQNDPRPLDFDCQCPACGNYSRAYLHHVFKAQEIISSMLLTWHNLHYYQQLMAKIRQAIENQRFEEFEAEFYKNLSLGDLEPI